MAEKTEKNICKKLRALYNEFYEHKLHNLLSLRWPSWPEPAAPAPCGAINIYQNPVNPSFLINSWLFNANWGIISRDLAKFFDKIYRIIMFILSEIGEKTDV